MAQIKTTSQAKRIRSGILLAMGKKSLDVMGQRITVSPELDQIVISFGNRLTKRAYFTTRFTKGDPSD